MFGTETTYYPQTREFNDRLLRIAEECRGTDRRIAWPSVVQQMGTIRGRTDKWMEDNLKQRRKSIRQSQERKISPSNKKALTPTGVRSRNRTTSTGSGSPPPPTASATAAASHHTTNNNAATAQRSISSTSATPTGATATTQQSATNSGVTSEHNDSAATVATPGATASVARTVTSASLDLFHSEGRDVSSGDDDVQSRGSDWYVRARICSHRGRAKLARASRLGRTIRTACIRE